MLASSPTSASIHTTRPVHCACLLAPASPACAHTERYVTPVVSTTAERVKSYHPYVVARTVTLAASASPLFETVSSSGSTGERAPEETRGIGFVALALCLLARIHPRSVRSPSGIAIAG